MVAYCRYFSGEERIKVAHLERSRDYRRAERYDLHGEVNAVAAFSAVAVSDSVFTGTLALIVPRSGR